PRQGHAQQLVLDLANLAQTTITATEEILTVANQVLELTPIGSMTLNAAWVTDVAEMANIASQASALAFDINSLQTQITQLFALSTDPTNATALEQRLTAIRQVITDTYIYAMRTQTLLFTALRTLQHLSGLVGAIQKFAGNKQGYQSMAQLQAQISLTI